MLRFIARHGEAFFANNSVNGIVNRLVFNGSNLDWEQHSFAPFHPVVYIATAATGAVLMAIPFLLRPRSRDLQERSPNHVIQQHRKLLGFLVHPIFQIRKLPLHRP